MRWLKCASIAHANGGSDSPQQDERGFDPYCTAGCTYPRKVRQWVHESTEVPAVTLDIDEFHTYRFESFDGVNYWISVDGIIFIVDAEDNPNGYHTLQFGGDGGCISDQILNMVNEGDLVRFGTISYGEQLVASDPPQGFVDAREHAALDRFTVTFTSPNYIYIDEIAVDVTGSVAPVIIQTRRRDNDEPDTVDIVLDRPIVRG